MNNYTYTYPCRNVYNIIENYTSHFIEKGCVWEGVGYRTKTVTYWPPQLSGYHSLFFPFSWAAQPGCLGAQPLLRHGSHSNIFSPTDLNFLSPGLYNNLTPTYFLWASQFSHSVQPLDSQGCPLISWYLRPDAPVIYTGAFLLLTAWLGQRSICNSMCGHR